MNISCTRSYHASIAELQSVEQGRCRIAIEQLRNNPNHPGLNFEYLGKNPAHNHHSIRASKELRIILGVDPNRHDPKNIVLAYAGHHDPAYQWSHNNGGHTDMDAGIPVSNTDSKSNELSQQLEKFSNAKDWQLFLHPDQQSLVHKKFFGEARILGAAGTGKTVLALHRAKWLGERYPEGKVLFTTFSRSLPTYYESLYQGIPNAPSNIDFINIDRLARQIVGDRPEIDTKLIDDTFNDAWDETVRGSALEQLPREYLKEEVDRVIKGRGASREEYLDTDKFQRIGRKRGFKRQEREICWQLKEAWDARLRQANKTTFVDILIAARDIARQQGGEYQSIIADEYQDFTLVGAQFLRALAAGDHKNSVPDDGLLFLGDAAQRIYAGGWRPVWANLRFTGRSETIHTNYRNTRRIVEAASKVRGTDKVGAGEDEPITEYKEFNLGDGVRPVFLNVTQEQEIKTIKREIDRLMREESIAHEDIGILVYHNKDAREISEALIKKLEPLTPCFLLSKMPKKPPGPGVRVGTYDRGKGMEFQGGVFATTRREPVPR